MGDKEITLNFLEDALFKLDIEITKTTDDREDKLRQKSTVENVINYVNTQC